MAAPLAPDTVAVRELPLDDLTIGEDVRLDEDDEALAELAASIHVLGVLQPLLVRDLGEGWEVVAGRRRLAAARMAGLETVPCILRQLDDNGAFDAALAENLHRRQLSWIEVALAYARLKDRGLLQKQIAVIVGKTETHVSLILKLLTIPQEIQDRVHRREIGYTTALDLATRGTTRKQGGGAGNKGPLTGEDAQIATHWRRRHDRLLGGIAQVIKGPDNAHELKQMLRRLLAIDRQQLDGDRHLEAVR